MGFYDSFLNPWSVRNMLRWSLNRVRICFTTVDSGYAEIILWLNILPDSEKLNDLKNYAFERKSFL